jgi:hypothetical protein
MWVIAVKERGEFESLREHLEATGKIPFERVTTATGGEIYRSPDGTPGPHLVKVPDASVKLHALAQWIHRNLRFTAIISSGVLRPCGAAQPASEEVFIPELACRSAGRLDMGSSPLLYEELSFDRELQSHIVQNVLRRPLETQGRICSVERVPNDREVVRWIGSELGCTGIDTFTAELLLIGKRFSTRVGCLKIWETAKDPVRKLVETWTLATL